ncbi:MAG: lytic murein transglycosylase [Alphaproteobacteria bacterium]|nr:MAG: lytic murein transglycosylase [Alphaproteobacteria bacterium]
MKKIAALLILSFWMLLPSVCHADDSDFQVWLSNFRTQAFKQGVSAETINKHFNSIQYLPDVIAKDRNQPEFKLTFAEYKKRIISPERLQAGRAALKQNEQYLNWVQEKSGVSKSVVVALWGIETRFGNVKGGYNILSALATLSYDGRRSAYFSKEFMTALQLIDKYPYLDRPMLSSWAGAVGQCQFMPTSYWNFAIDGNNNGRVDLWEEREDVLASAANYLMKSGWKAGQPWGVAAKGAEHIDPSQTGLEVQKPIAEWLHLGVKPGKIVGMNITDPASLIMPDGPKGPAFLVFNNYRTIMSWNRSHNFALTVGSLADQIAVPGKSKQKSTPSNHKKPSVNPSTNSADYL